MARCVGRRDPLRGVISMVRNSRWVLIATALLVWGNLDVVYAQSPPEWEVRTFLDNNTDPTYQFRQSAIKQRYVCPYCSYSSPFPGNCPDPWNAAGHPGTVALMDMATKRTQRVLSLATPDMPANRRDLELPDVSRTLHGRAVLGRPFHPWDVRSDLSPDLRRATLHVQVANVDGNLAAPNADRYRFLIIPPTPSSTDSGDITSRRPMAQPDPDLVGMMGLPPRGLHIVQRDPDPGAQLIPNDQLPNYLTVGLNPYRVDEGDQWFIRIRERSLATDGDVEWVQVEIFSILYGLIADLTLDPAGNTPVDYPFRVLTDNGACLLAVARPLHQYDPAAGIPWQPNTTQTWTLQFMSRSNCRLMPGWQDMMDDANDPPYLDILGISHGNPAFDLINDPFPAAKRCWFADSGGVPAFTDESNIVGTGVLPRPYLIPVNCTGRGTVAVQYAGEVGAAWTPDPTVANGSDTTYYRSGGEWQYDAYELVTNADIAGNTNSFDPATPSQAPYVRMAASHFMSTRVDVPPTANTWIHGTASENAEVDSTPEWAYPRIIIGWLDPPPGLNVTGDFPPGSITPLRRYPVSNRWNSVIGGTMVCPVCGMVWSPDMGPAPPACPYHAGNVAPVPVSGIGGGSFTSSTDVWRTATTVGLDERLVPPVPAQHILRSDAYEYGNTWLGTSANYKYGGTARQSVNVRIPRFQPPSVPPGGSGAVNDPTNDFGYRGGRIVFRSASVGGSVGMSGSWDAYFKCPDCGHFFNVDDPASHGCGQPHLYCPLCGGEHRLAGNCPFDGAVLVTIPNNLACRHEHLEAEEFDAFDVQVSVNRKAGEVASSLAATDMGRTAPGTPSLQPDTTVAPLTAHQAFPADVSAMAPYLMLNLGNVATPLRLANVYDFSPALDDVALFDYHRADIDPLNHSFGRLAEASPLTRDTFRPFDLSLTPSLQWTVYPASVGDPSGRETVGFISAGSYATPVKPVPMGQPVGVYTGAQLHYVDANGNGAFDFQSMATGNAETTRTMRFNPSTDLALEPLAAVVPGTVHVTESRLPHSDYYAADSDPVVLISMPDRRLQVIWASDRVSADSAVNGSAAPGLAAPAGLDPSAIPSSTGARNLVYATATGATGGNDDPLYRIYYWPTTGGVLDEATALSADPSGTVNSAPWAMPNLSGDRWAFWHRSVRHAGGVESTLRYDSSAGGTWAWNGSGPGEFIYDTGLGKRNLRGFATATGAWLFWHTGTEGRERLMYRWDFTGTPDNHEGPVPLVNQVSGGQINDVVNTLEGYTVRRHAGNPFTYAKDPSVFVESASDVVDVFFSGYLRQEEQADICWTRYQRADMKPASVNDPTSNQGKLAFAPVNNEELHSDGLRQRFSSRHLDWLLHPAYEASPFGPGPLPDTILRLGLVYDAFGDNTPPRVEVFDIVWQPADRGEYTRRRGTYRVTPILIPYTAGATPPASSVIPMTMTNGTAGWYLRDPSTSVANPRPLTMEIDPSAGVVQFSSPLYNQSVEEYRRLFNPAAPVDPTTVFNSSMVSGGVPLADVVMNAWYIPYVWRVTRSGAQDDSPSAFYGVSSANRLTIFWRRSYPASEAPHFGRAAFMYKVLSNSIHVGRPPVSGAPTFTDLTAGGAVTPMASDNVSGTYTFPAGLDGHYVRVDYTGPGGVNYSERHQIVGWSTENIVPVDTVIGEGPLVAVPEIYDVPDGTGAGTMPAVRYWLFWSSPRGVWDLRLAEDPAGTRVGPGAGGVPDMPVHISTDIFSAVVAPEFGSLRPEMTVSSVTSDPT